MKQRESAILAVSDIHFGKATATYTPDIAAERLHKVGERLGRIRELLADYIFDELVVCILGDVVDGAGVYPTQYNHQELTNADEQADAMSTLLAEFAEDQKNRWGKVRLECVPGNHGRSGKFSHESQNYDLTTYKYLGLRLTDKRLTVHVNAESDPFIRTIEARGHRYILYHGHGIKMYQQVPWYGITQRVMRWHTSSLAPFDCVMMGHFHQCQMLSVNRIPVFLTGTPVTSDDWALQQLGVESQPRWWLYGVSDSRAVTWQFRIELD